MNTKPKVVELGAHERMSPHEVLSQALRENWDVIIVCGYHKDDPEFITRSSETSRESALWILEHAKLHALGRL